MKSSRSCTAHYCRYCCQFLSVTWLISKEKFLQVMLLYAGVYSRPQKLRRYEELPWGVCLYRICFELAQSTCFLWAFFAFPFWQSMCPAIAVLRDEWARLAGRAALIIFAPRSAFTRHFASHFAIISSHDKSSCQLTQCPFSAFFRFKTLSWLFRAVIACVEVWKRFKNNDLSEMTLDHGIRLF